MSGTAQSLSANSLRGGRKATNLNKSIQDMLESFGSTSGSFIERVNSEVMQYKAHVKEGTGLFFLKDAPESSKGIICPVGGVGRFLFGSLNNSV